MELPATLVRVAIATGLLVAAVAAVPAAEDAPLDVIRSVHERVASLLQRSKTLGPQDRETVLALIADTSDFATISATVIGPRWATVPPAQRDAFVRAFSRLVGHSSVEKMGRFRADRFDILRQSVDGARATVQTVAQYQGTRVTLDYELMSVGGAWKIVDYTFNGVVSSQSYRKQFDRILQKEDFSSLLRRLEQRLQKYEKPASPSPAR